MIATIAELAWRSHQIVVGTVVERLPPVWGDVLNPEQSNYRPIYTDYVVQVEQRLRGKPGASVRVRQLGGTIDGCTQKNGNEVPMTVGDRVLLFLTAPVPDADAPTYFITGVEQGFWSVRDDGTVDPLRRPLYDQHAGRTVAEIRRAVAEALSSKPPKAMSVPAVSLADAPLALAQ
ncbi:MAG: hypothetical protein QJR03_16205 [Sphaerobacter sp.]|nr:hypothetical protein [Sphaerobacter sp.]